MNALAIHLYLTITFINLVIIRLAQNYRIIEYIRICKINGLARIRQHSRGVKICYPTFFYPLKGFLPAYYYFKMIKIKM